MLILSMLKICLSSHADKKFSTFFQEPALVQTFCGTPFRRKFAPLNFRMRAALVHKFGGEDEIHVEERLPLPSVGEKQVNFLKFLINKLDSVFLGSHSRQSSRRQSVGHLHPLRFLCTRTEIAICCWTRGRRHC
jgi:hypothetical protein